VERLEPRDARGQKEHRFPVPVAALERTSKLALARSVQQRMYPASPPDSRGFDIAGIAVPADETGGDYYDHLRLPGGGLTLAVGDVSGHGSDAALHVIQARTMLRAVILTQSDPGAALSRMNSLLLDELDEHRFMTLVLACLDSQSRTLRYASAGHTTGYLLEACGRLTAELPSTGVPLGLICGANFESVSVAGLEEGDIVALFTDGIVESADDAAYYGPEGALRELRRHRHESASDIVQHVCEDAQAFGRGPQLDDMTMVVCMFGACHGDRGAPAS